LEGKTDFDYIKNSHEAIRDPNNGELLQSTVPSDFKEISFVNLSVLRGIKP